MSLYRILHLESSAGAGLVACAARAVPLGAALSAVALIVAALEVGAVVFAVSAVTAPLRRVFAGDTALVAGGVDVVPDRSY